jgi:pulcherriminic acid synthase
MPITPSDLHAQPYFDDPFPVWTELRHEQPLFHDTVDDRWLLTRYDDVATVFRDHATYSTKPYERIFTDVIGPTMVQMDCDDHDVRRAIVAPALVGRPLQTDFVPLIDKVVDDLLGRLPPRGTVDLMAELTMPLPIDRLVPSPPRPAYRRRRVAPRGRPSER